MGCADQGHAAAAYATTDETGQETCRPARCGDYRSFVPAGVALAFQLGIEVMLPPLRRFPKLRGDEPQLRDLD